MPAHTQIASAGQRLSSITSSKPNSKAALSNLTDWPTPSRNGVPSGALGPIGPGRQATQPNKRAMAALRNLTSRRPA